MLFLEGESRIVAVDSHREDFAALTQTQISLLLALCLRVWWKFLYSSELIVIKTIVDANGGMKSQS